MQRQMRFCSHLSDGTITNTKIADATIDSAKIANLSADKINAGTLNVDRINAGSIMAAKINSEAYLGGKQLNSTAYGSFTYTGEITITHNLGRYAMVALTHSLDVAGYHAYIRNQTINSFNIWSPAGGTVTYSYL